MSDGRQETPSVGVTRSMSDVGLNLYGVIAFIVAGCLSVALLAAMAVCALYARARAQRRKALRAHLAGMALSLSLSLSVMLFIFFTDGMEQARAVNIWLDEWAWLWACAILSAWPLYVSLRRRRAG